MDSTIANNNDVHVDLETNNTNLETLSKRLTHKPEISYAETFNRCCYLLYVNILAIPFIVCNLYYSTNDESCVNIYPNNLSISYADCLITDGIFGIFQYMWFIHVILSTNNTKVINNFMMGKTNNPYMWVMIQVFKLFGLSWTLVESILFWGYIHDKCDTNVYTYIKTTLIIRYVSYGILTLNKIFGKDD